MWFFQEVGNIYIYFLILILVSLGSFVIGHLARNGRQINYNLMELLKSFVLGLLIILILVIGYNLLKILSQLS